MQFSALPKSLLLIGTLSMLFACNTATSSGGSPKKGNANSPDSDIENADSTQVIKTHVAPPSGSKYVYAISNETETEIEVNGKTVNTRQKSDVGITYDIQKDSAGNYLLKMHYNNIHLYSKSGDNETQFDAGSAGASEDPTERMLGLLKEANISATISPAGNVMNINGYKELGEKILSHFVDEPSRNLVKNQWEKIVGEGMVKKNIELLFNILPDQSKRVGDTWKKEMQQKGEFDMNVATTFTLKDIEDGIAKIESAGDMTGAKGETNIMGYTVTPDLTGSNEGQYEVETQTGMVLKNASSSELKGTLQMLGKEIPLTVKTKLSIKGKKL